MRTFRALQTFKSEETKSWYTQVLTYTVRPGNRLLNALAEVWALQGKVTFNHIAVPPPIEGIGTVTRPHSEDPSFWEMTKKAWTRVWQSVTQPQ
jgi:hypothetical protein